MRAVVLPLPSETGRSSPGIFRLLVSGLPSVLQKGPAIYTSCPRPQALSILCGAVPAGLTAILRAQGIAVIAPCNAAFHYPLSVMRELVSSVSEIKAPGSPPKPESIVDTSALVSGYVIPRPGRSQTRRARAWPRTRPEDAVCVNLSAQQVVFSQRAQCVMKWSLEWSHAHYIRGSGPGRTPEP
ncbi:hypothetical protein SKAU_G00157220 [Synaphobranchus kaupii]|uniref:Uncharacterized protein n=1 Tax=Synaphobranchus kaupii TaxID=118154 RepID=A0A9Q1FHS4_SYNKA|nr:hypothetical protein SKAU_G00157220 [Synaphobranchus kaupii]